MKDEFLLEKAVEKHFTAAMQKAGAWALKFESPGVSGVPDRLVLCQNGGVFFAEIKRPGENLRPLQRTICKKIELFYRIPVLVIRSADDIEKAVALATTSRADTMPEPVTIMKENDVKSWLAKVDEELNEFKETFYAGQSDARKAEEGADVITAVTSMLQFFGITRSQRILAQIHVNEHNAARGRFGNVD